MKDFTFKEIDHLIAYGWLGEDSRHKFGINYASKSTNQGFGWYSIKKHDNDEIEYNAHYPVNVDPDDGSCDMEHVKKLYHSFDDYINNKPYHNEKN